MHPRWEEAEDTEIGDISVYLVMETKRVNEMTSDSSIPQFTSQSPRHMNRQSGTVLEWTPCGTDPWHSHGYICIIHEYTEWYDKLCALERSHDGRVKNRKL
jgi:hypothetical protein